MIWGYININDLTLSDIWQSYQTRNKISVVTVTTDSSGFKTATRYTELTKLLDLRSDHCLYGYKTEEEDNYKTLARSVDIHSANSQI